MKLLLSLLLALCASANQITYTTSIPMAETGFTNSVPFAQFNPGIGTLTAATVKLSLSNNITAWVESHDTHIKAATLGGALTLTASYPTNTITVVSTNTVRLNLGKTDGVDDYAGVSGAQYAGNAVVSSTQSAPLFDLTGFGTFNIVVTASGATLYAGPGDYVGLIGTAASAIVAVTYTYTP